MSEEQNSAEAEAERILKDAFKEADLEECPQGESCPVHFRVDEVVLDEPSMYARLINYSGDYVVVTEDNHELDDLAMVLRILLGKVAKEDLPARWETTIYHVGEGSLGDLQWVSQGERVNALRYSQTHDDWKSVKPVHETTLSALQAGLIDVSKPVGEG